MVLSEETVLELYDAVDNYPLPREYSIFARKWIAFNRAYNDLSREREEWSRIRSLGESIQPAWEDENVQALAHEMVTMECVGGVRLEGEWMLQPSNFVKAATLHLRGILLRQIDTNPASCEFAHCRQEKRRLCDQIPFDVDVNPSKFLDREIVALLRILYQVRSNLMHGEKRIHGGDVQTERDQHLVDVATRVLDALIPFVIAKHGGEQRETAT